ncbi:unnamed protein product [Ectocarpus sp. CCAP 1310/34]|nr:unnamed protein product [Ectocarpus sp. CCAP 1310/34]
MQVSFILWKRTMTSAFALLAALLFVANVHAQAACPDGTNLCLDPHMKGLFGQNIDWFGVDGGWYSFVRDPDIDLNVNVRLTAPLPEEFPDRQLVTGLSVVRLTAPLPEEFPDRQLVTGLSVMARGHSLVIEVRPSMQCTV